MFLRTGCKMGSCSNGKKFKVYSRESSTYTAPNERMAATDNFILRFICNFQTRNIGRIPMIQSETTLIPEKAQVKLISGTWSMHLPVAPRYCVQKNSVGLHWKTIRPREVMENIIFMTRRAHKVMLCHLETQMRRSRTQMLARMAIAAQMYSISPIQNHCSLSANNFYETWLTNLDALYNHRKRKVD